MTTNQSNGTAARTEQDEAFTKLAERMVDFAEAGIERFGTPEAFLAALTTYNQTR